MAHEGNMNEIEERLMRPLTEELVALKSDLNHAVYMQDKLRSERDAAEAEATRLRDALDGIVHTIYSNEATLPWIERKAREALGVK